MSANEMLEKIGDSLGSTATVKSVYGEPIQSGNRTVVPIARVAYGFGGGFGVGKGRLQSPDGPQAEGGGGGGGVAAMPAGALEISPTGTRFIPYTSVPLLAAAFGAGALFGGILFRRRKRA